MTTTVTLDLSKPAHRKALRDLLDALERDTPKANDQPVSRLADERAKRALERNGFER